jgi:GTP-binding protein HflX
MFLEKDEFEKREAIIISLDKDIVEISELVRTLNLDIISIFTQNRKTPDVNFWIGKGKLEEVLNFHKNNPPPFISTGRVVMVNGMLKPSQQFLMEKTLGLDVWDRIRLILEIFTSRAKTEEAILQVRSAKIRYEVPFVRELIHRAKLGEHPGFLAGGAYKVEDYYEMIRRHNKQIRKNLEQIRKERDERRKSRRKEGFFLVSIAGYTNAGKSTVLNSLSGASSEVDDRLFTTLSICTRKLKGNEKILFTDTVGLIRGMPNWLIDAFRSTFEEIELADCIVLVADCSDDYCTMLQKLKFSLSQLTQIGTGKKIIIALNKIDLIDEYNCNRKIEGIQKEINDTIPIIPISATEGRELEALTNVIKNSLPTYIKAKIEVQYEHAQEIISYLSKEATIRKVAYKKTVEIYAECSEKILDYLLRTGNCKIIRE